MSKHARPTRRVGGFDIITIADMRHAHTEHRAKDLFHTLVFNVDAGTGTRAKAAKNRRAEENAWHQGLRTGEHPTGNGRHRKTPRHAWEPMMAMAA